MAKKDKITYLLALEGPTYTAPVGLFDDLQEALDWAADNPALHEGAIGNGLWEQLEAWDPQNSPYASHIIEDHGYSANRPPMGYSLWRFKNGIPDGYTLLEPYVFREAVLTTEPPKPLDPPTTDPGSLFWSTDH